MTARVTDFGALRIQSAGLQAGEGIRWRLSLPAGSYRLTDVSGNLRDDLMVAITSDGIIHALTGARPTIEFTLHEDTECSFVIAARHQATGKQVDDVFLPMLSAVDSGAITWQPPETLTAQGTEYMPQNLIINPSFEDGLTGWTSSVPSALTTVDSEPGSSIKSAKDGRLYLKNATNGINKAARSSTFNVIPGATLKVSAWGGLTSHWTGILPRDLFRRSGPNHRRKQGLGNCVRLDGRRRHHHSPRRCNRSATAAVRIRLEPLGLGIRNRGDLT